MKLKFSFKSHLKLLIALIAFMGSIGGNNLKAQAITGQDYWFTLPFNGGSSPVYYIYIVSQFGIDNATIDIPFYNRSETFSVEPGEFYSIAIPMNNFSTGQDGYHTTPDVIENKGVHITSPKPISVYVLNYARNSSDGETLLPTTMLGTDYVLGFRSNGTSVKSTIVATEDQTKIDIKSWGNAGQYLRTITLNKGQTYMWQTNNDCSGDYATGGIACSGLTGSTVTSDKKIAVFGHADCGNIGATGRCDAMMVTYLPRNRWSQSYTTAQVIDRDNRVLNGPDGNNTGVDGSGDYVEVIGPIGANVSVTRLGGVNNFTIQAPTFPGGNYGYGYSIFELPEAINQGEANYRITADQPIQIIQYTKGRGIDGNAFADPESFNAFPENLWKNSYFFYPIFTPSFNILADPNSQKLGVTIIVKDVGLPLSSESIELNGINVNSIDPTPWTQIDGTPYKFKRVQPDFISSRIESTNGANFGFYFFPVSERESSIFSGGYGPLDNVSLCEQFADIDILSTGTFCLNNEISFDPRIYTFTVPNNLSYKWKFGDGAESTNEKAKHSYASLGNYTVELEISDNAGCVLKTSRRVVISDLKVSISPSAADLCLGESVKLVANATLQPSGQVNVKYANTTAIPIPDISITENWPGNNTSSGFGNKPISSIINVPEFYSNAWTLDSVCVNIRHSKVRDVQVSLESPDGVLLKLANSQDTKGRANFRKTCFSKTSNISINSALAPFTGNFNPSSGIANWPSASQPQGNWTLRVGDDSVFVSGTLLDWSIFFTTQNKVTKIDWNPTSFLNRFDSLVVTSTPSSSIDYNLTLTDFTQCVGKATAKINVVTNDIIPTVQDSILCNSVDSVNLFNFILPPGVPLIGQWVSSTPGFNAAKLKGNYFITKDLPAGTYNFTYLLPNNPIRCGFDSAKVSIRINQLPKLGLPGDTVLCSNSSVVKLIDVLNGTPDQDGYFTRNGLLVSNQFNPVLFSPGLYDFYYKKDVPKCASDSSKVGIELNRQPVAGKGRDTTLCETKVPLQLNSLLTGADADGIWVSDQGLSTGAFFPGGIFVTFGVPAGVYTFRYTLKGISPCTNVETLVKVTVRAAPIVDLTSTTPKLCIDSTAKVQVNVTGVGPYTFKVSDGTTEQTFTNAGSVTNFNAKVSANTLYIVTEITDSSTPKCTVKNADSLLIEVYEPLQATLIKEICPTGVGSPEFFAKVELKGGDSTSYKASVKAVNLNSGANFSQTGISFNSREFNSPLLPNGAHYTITFSDATSCSADSIVDVKYCECESEAATMDTKLISVCEDDIATALVTGTRFQELDPSTLDTVVYVLHTKSGINLGDVLLASRNPAFAYDASKLQYGKTYYISEVVGDLGNYFGFSYDGVNKLPIDTCLDVSRGTPVIFNQKPSVTIIGDQELCKGELAPVNFNFTSGKAPFTITLNNGVKDTSFVINTSAAVVNFFPQATVTYSLVNILDANSCTNQPIASPQTFTMLVNELPTATIVSSSAVICEGGSAALEIALTGNGPWVFEYTLNGIRQAPLTAVASPYVIQVDKPGFYKLIAVKDAKCIGEPNGGVVEVIVRKPPVAEAGPNQDVCGLNSVLAAVPSFGVGTWTEASNKARFANNHSGFTAVAFPIAGTYILRWTEENPPCPSDFDEMVINVTDLPTTDAGKDTSVCGLSYTLQAKPSVGQGFWTSVNPNATIANAQNPNTLAQVTSTGKYNFVWQENVSNLCSDVDTVQITFTDTLKVTILDTICNNIATGYQLRILLENGLPGTYKSNGTPVLGQFTSNFIPNGVSNTISLSDASKCNETKLTTNYTCPCISYSGTVGADTIKVCDGTPLILKEDFNSVLDGNDTLIYILHGNAGANLDAVYASSGINRFDSKPSGLAYNQVYYGSVVVGNKQNGSLGYNGGDRCLSVAIGTPIIFKGNSTLSATEVLNFCEGANYEIPVYLSSNDTYTLNYRENGLLRSASVKGPLAKISINPNVGENFYNLETVTVNNDNLCPKILSSLVKVTVEAKPSINLNFKDKICVGEQTQVFNTTSANIKLITWNFENLPSTTNLIPKLSYNQAGLYDIQVILVSNSGCADTLIFNNKVSVANYPSADFTLNADTNLPTICAPATLLLQKFNQTFTTNRWLLDNSLIFSNSSSISVNLQDRGNYQIRHEVVGDNGCSSVRTKTIKGVKPHATLKVASTTICNGTLLNSFIENIQDGDSTQLIYTAIGLNDTIVDKNSAGKLINLAEDVNQVLVAMRVFDKKAACVFDTTITVNVLRTLANFTMNDSLSDTLIVCLDTNNTINFENTSALADDYTWNLGNGNSTTLITPNPQYYYKAGTYKITLKATERIKACNSTITKTLIVNPLPRIYTTTSSDSACFNTPFVIESNGALRYEYIPSTGVVLSGNGRIATIKPQFSDTTIQYQIIGTDKNGCVDSSGVVRIKVSDLKAPNIIENGTGDSTAVILMDSTIVVGDTIAVNLPKDPRYKYTWTPVVGTACVNCDSQRLTPQVSTTYIIQFEDRLKCYTKNYRFTVTVDAKYSFSMPDAFSPNGDGINELINPDGWGIGKLISFEVYNRSGVLLHKAAGVANESVAWDGTYKGKLQAADSYYYVARYTYIGQVKEIIKSGEFKLLR